MLASQVEGFAQQVPIAAAGAVFLVIAQPPARQMAPYAHPTSSRLTRAAAAYALGQDDQARAPIAWQISPHARQTPSAALRNVRITFAPRIYRGRGPFEENVCFKK